MGFHKKSREYFRTGAEDLEEGRLQRFLDQVGASAPREETDFPSLDIYEKEEFIIVEVELPGISTEDLEVSAAAGTLVIEGLKRETLEPGRINFLCMERTFGSFRRFIPLLQPVDASQIKAAYRFGILEIRIPKLNERRGRRQVIPVATD